MPTRIEWSDETWNPLAGCEWASPGCDRCYAARETAGRLSGHPVYAGLATVPDGAPARFTGEVRTLPDRLSLPLRWRRPRMIFVNSMSDLFHPGVERAFIASTLAVMAAAERHTFQVLTKRTPRMAMLLDRPDFREEVAYAAAPLAERGWTMTWPLPNVWWGTSIESDDFTWRADRLRDTPAAVRFVSAEPLLGPLPSLDMDGIDWLIVGGESGRDAEVRPMHPAWALDLRDRAQAAGVAFHFKQWGEWSPAGSPVSVDCMGQSDIVYAADGSTWPCGSELAGCQRWWPWEGGDGPKEHRWPDGSTSIRTGKKAAGRLLDGRTWDEAPR